MLVPLATIAAASFMLAGCGTTETIVVKAEAPTTIETHTVTEQAYTPKASEPAQIVTCYHMEGEEGGVAALVKFPDHPNGWAWRAKVRFTETLNDGQFDEEVIAEDEGGQATVYGGETPTSSCQVTSVERVIHGEWQRVAGKGPEVSVQAGSAS